MDNLPSGSGIVVQYNFCFGNTRSNIPVSFGDYLVVIASAVALVVLDTCSGRANREKSGKNEDNK